LISEDPQFLQPRPSFGISTGEDEFESILCRLPVFIGVVGKASVRTLCTAAASIASRKSGKESSKC